MKTPRAMQVSQIEKFALFLDEHPAFSPELMGDDAYVYGFRVGESFLSVSEMEKLIDTPVDGQCAALLQSVLLSVSRRGRPWRKRNF